MPSTTTTLRRSIAGLAAAAALATLGACGKSDTVTVTPDGAVAAGGVTADGGSVGATPDVDVSVPGLPDGGIPAGGAAGTFDVTGDLVLSGALTSDGSVKATCNRGGGARTLTATLSDGTKAEIDLVSETIGSVTVTKAGQSWNATIVGSSSGLTLDAESFTIDGLTLSGAGEVQLVADFDC